MEKVIANIGLNSPIRNSQGPEYLIQGSLRVHLSVPEREREEEAREAGRGC